jgi:hypothetical protein
MDDKTTIKSAPIWPGPECLRERPARLVMRPTRGSYYPAAVLRLVDGGVWIDGCVYDSRHVMPGVTIALAWEAVRARMERFVMWLESEGLTGVAMLSRAHASPEAATAEAIEAGCRWPFSRCGVAWDAAWLLEARTAADFDLMGRRLFRSPEWAALPFNASEVGRG